MLPRLAPCHTNYRSLQNGYLRLGGNTVDYGCFAPVQAFMEVFKHYGDEPTMEETRKPMGMLKIDHIRTMLHMERIEAQWQAVHGRLPEKSDVQKMYPLFEEKLFSILGLLRHAEARSARRRGRTARDGRAHRVYHGLYRRDDGRGGACRRRAGLCARLHGDARCGRRRRAVRIRTWCFAICENSARRACPRSPKWAIP